VKRNLVILVTAVFMFVVGTVFSLQTKPTVQATSDKCYSNCTDPNAPTYDLWGNEWSATGTLIHATCPNVPDPISGKDNPECVCPANNSQGQYYIQGYDKTTNAVVCGFGYYDQCPYANSVQGGTPECDKLAPSGTVNSSNVGGNTTDGSGKSSTDCSVGGSSS
jgi:hypothetical protein